MEPGNDKDFDNQLTLGHNECNELIDFKDVAELENIKVNNVLNILRKVDENDFVEEEVDPKAREPLYSQPPTGGPPKPKPFTWYAYFFCDYNVFFKTNKKTGDYIELPMGPNPPHYGCHYVTRNHLALYDKKTQEKKAENEKKRQKNPKLQDADLPNEPYWTQFKIWTMVRPTMMNGCGYRFVQEALEFSMPLFMRFFLKELTNSDEEGRRVWYMVVQASSAVLAVLLAGICKERANFFVGASFSKAGQTLRCLVYKRLAQADFMFLLNVNAGLITRLGTFEVDGILAFICSIPNQIADTVFILATFAVLIEDVGKLAVYIILILLGFLSILCYLNFTVVRRWRAYSNLGNDRAVTLRELIPNIGEVKRCGFEDFFHYKLNKKRNVELDALYSMHKIQNILNFCFELTFLVTAFLNVIFYINNQEKVDGQDVKLNTAVAFSQIALVNGMRGNFQQLMELVVNFNEYYLSKVSMDLFLNKVKVRPDTQDYIDKSMAIGHIKGVECEFGINDIEHITICEKLKKTDAYRFNQKESLDVYQKIQEFKHELETEAQNEKRKKHIALMNETGKKFFEQTVVFSQKSFEILPGQKICICGSENDGKSMFCFSLLGETVLMNGSLKYNGSIAYLTTKKPSFVGGTIRDNITLFKTFNKQRYDKACEIGRLNTKRYPGRDFFTVVDSGANLMPHEKWQVIVARMIYHDSDILILDEFFDQMSSQLRVAYSKSIFDYCEENNKTLIYCSAYETLAKKSDKVFFLNDCTMVESGTFNELNNKINGGFAKFIRKRKDESHVTKSFRDKKNFKIPPWLLDDNGDDFQVADEREEEIKPQKLTIVEPSPILIDETKVLSRKLKRADTRHGGSTCMLTQKLEIKQKEEGITIESALLTLMKNCIKKQDGDIMAAEQDIRVDNFKEVILDKFLLINGPKRLIWQTFIGCVQALIYFSIDLYLILIVNDKQTGMNLNLQLYIWGLIALFSSFVIWFRDSHIRESNIQTSNILYRRCIKKLLCTRMDWFQKNSMSGLVYILTEDITNIDFYFNEAKMLLIETLFNLIIALVVCNYLQWVLITIPLILGFYCFYPSFKVYLKAVQYFYKMEQKTKTSLYSVYLQTFAGIIIYRNMGMPRFFDNKFIKATSEYARSLTLLINHCGKFIGIRSVLLNTYFLLLVYFIPIFVKQVIHKSTTDLWLSEPWMTPLAVSWTYKAIKYMNTIVRVLPNFLKYTFSIKRAEEFLDHPMILNLHPARIDSEAHHEYSIEMKNHSYSYGFNKKCLFDLNLKIERGKRVAIVGTSSAGKHSQFNMLQKIYERIDKEEADSRVKKETILFKNTDIWFDEYFDEIEKSNPEKYPKKGSHPDREYPNSRGDAFKIWTSFISNIVDDDKAKENLITEDDPTKNIGKDSYLKIFGQNYDDLSTFELRRHIACLRSKAMIYNGTVLENIDFAGEFKDSKWGIVKILSYLGFFDSLMDNMNFRNLKKKFKESFFDPAVNMRDEDFDAKQCEMVLPAKRELKPTKIPKNETDEQKTKREEAEEIKRNDDKQLTVKIERALLKEKSLKISQMEFDYEDTQRNSYIKKNYELAENEQTGSIQPKMTRRDLMDYFTENSEFDFSKVQFGLKDSSVWTKSDVSYKKVNSFNSNKNETPIRESNLQDNFYLPPNAGKKDAKVQTDFEREKLDKQKLKELMKKIYDGENFNQYTIEDMTQLKISEEDWLHSNNDFTLKEKNPISKTLKDYLGSRLAYHKADLHEAMVINDILEAEVKPFGSNFGRSLRKLINAARVLLHKKPIFICDDDAQMLADKPTLLDDVFNELKDTTILTIVRDCKNLLYFDKVIVMDNGFVIEEGDPKELQVDKQSHLYSTIKKIDKNQGSLVEDSLEKKWRPKKIFETYFRIPSWFKKLGYKVLLFE